MNLSTRWIAHAALAAGLGLAALAAPQTAQAQDPLTRVIVDVADVVLRGGQPYYRYGDYGQRDRLIVERDRYGRPVYYRVIDRRAGPPYGNAYGYYRNGPGSRDRDGQMRCDKRGNCRVNYYDPRYDRRGEYRVYDDYARRYSRGGR